LRLTRKSVLLFWMVGIILSMCTACTETTLKPEAALWGHWAVVAGQGGEPPLANNLIFYEDGRLVMDGEHSQPALYVVIAPGRMKLTRGDEILVLNYSVDEGMLQLNTEGKNQRFTYLGEPEIAVLSTAVSQVSPTAPEPLTLQPPTFTPTILLITSTPDLPTSTPVLPTATEAIPTQTPTDSLEDFYVDVKVIPKDGMVMVFVPEGEFIMGTNPNEDPFFWGAEGPAHEVYVDAFWIARPNNPTGNLFSKGLILKLARRFPQKWFIVDEAFIQFLADWKTNSLLTENPIPNILVLHSLTKFFAIAGLRLGGIVGSEPAISRLKKAKEPWTINGIADRVASLLVKCSDYEEETRSLVKQECSRVFNGLQAVEGIIPYPSSSNYILSQWVKSGNLDDLLRYLLLNGAYVRDCRNFPGLEKNFFRIGLKKPKDNDLLLSLLLSFQPSQSGL